GLTTPNPTAVAQEGRVGQPPQGIVRVTRHPFLTGVGLWALVHLIGNGDVASLFFFATWAIVALAGTVSIDAKRRRLLGAAWEPFAGQTSIVPFAAIAAGRNRFIPREIGLWRWAIAVLAYVLMLGGHAPIVGVSPFPGRVAEEARAGPRGGKSPRRGARGRCSPSWRAGGAPTPARTPRWP